VENRLFKIPRSVFEDSVVFQDMYNLPAPALSQTPPDGTDADHPLHIPGVTISEFKSFLTAHLPEK
jgi:hypothetical protein